MQNILLVDDNKYILEALSLTLHDCAKGYAYLMAKNGLEALHILVRRQVDLVLTDLEMPVMNGYMLIKHKNQLHPSTPLLAMTSNFSPAVADRLRSLGVKHCIEKPFDYEEVTRLIMKSLTPPPFMMPGKEVPVHCANA